MKAMNEYFNALKDSISHEVNTAVIGTVDRVNGNTVDVATDSHPLLINLPTLTLGETETIYHQGDEVLVVFLNSNISNGVVVGRIQ